MSKSSLEEGGQFVETQLDVNFERDAWFLQESACLGDDLTQFRLGLYYGMRIKALEIAADRGNVEAQYNLGIIYRYI